jgi:hypothetical protein
MNFQFDSNGNYDEDLDEAYFESDDDSYDAYDDDAYGESDDDSSEARASKKVRKAQGAKGRPMKKSQPQAYKGAATINTPAGQAKVNLPPDLVSKKEFKELEAKVIAINEANLKNGKAIDVLSDNTKKLEQRLEKLGADTKKQFGAISQGQMMSAFIPPTLKSFKSQGDATETTVVSSSFDMTNAMLPMLLSGGMSGSSGSNDMMMPMMIMAMNQGSSNDNSMMFLMMAMMMGNK